MIVKAHHTAHHGIVYYVCAVTTDEFVGAQRFKITDEFVGEGRIDGRTDRIEVVTADAPAAYLRVISVVGPRSGDRAGEKRCAVSGGVFEIAYIGDGPEIIPGVGAFEHLCGVRCCGHVIETLSVELVKINDSGADGVVRKIRGGDVVAVTEVEFVAVSRCGAVGQQAVGTSRTDIEIRYFGGRAYRRDGWFVAFRVTASGKGNGRDCGRHYERCMDCLFQAKECFHAKVIMINIYVCMFIRRKKSRRMDFFATGLQS